MNPDCFTDYIKDDMCHGPDTLVAGVYGYHPQESYLPFPPTLNVDVDILLLLVQEEIQTIEHPIRNQWGQGRWDNNPFESNEIPNRLEDQEELEIWLRSNTPSEASLNANSDSDAHSWSLDPYNGAPLPIVLVSDDASPVCEQHPTTLLYSTESMMDEPLLACTVGPSQGFKPTTPTEESTKAEDSPISARSSKAPDAEGPPTEGISHNISCHHASSLTKPLPGNEVQAEIQLVSGADSPDSLPEETLARVLPDALPSLPEVKASLNVDVLSSKPKSPETDREIDVSSCPSETPLTDSPSAVLDCHYTTGGRALRKRPVPRTQCQLSLTEDTIERARNSQPLRSASERKKRQRSHEHMDPSTKSKSRLASSLPSEDSPSASSEPSGSQQQPSLPLDQSSLLEVTNDKARKCRRKRRETRELDSQKFEEQLLEWGFVRKGINLRCPCSRIFTRRWDAARHWKNASVHKAERQRLGDFSDSTENRCTGCGEVLSRKDSLARHIPNCGQRKKRRHPYGWNPNASSEGG